MYTTATMGAFLDNIQYYLEHPSSFYVYLFAMLCVATIAIFTVIYTESISTGESMSEYVANRFAGKPLPARGPEAIAARGQCFMAHCPNWSAWES